MISNVFRQNDRRASKERRYGERVMEEGGGGRVREGRGGKGRAGEEGREGGRKEVRRNREIEGR